MIFNIGLALLFLPFIGLIATFSKIIVKDEAQKKDPAAPRYLKEKGIETPS